MGFSTSRKPALRGSLTLDAVFDAVADGFDTTAEEIACSEGGALYEARLAVVYIAVRLVLLSCLKEADPPSSARWVAGRAFSHSIRGELGDIFGCSGDEVCSIYWDAVDLHKRDAKYRENADCAYRSLASEHDLHPEQQGVAFTA